MVSLGSEALAILFSLASLPICLGLTRFFMYWNFSRGIVGVDIHKPGRPRIPEMCGVAVPITLIGLAAAYSLTPGLDRSTILKLTAYSLVVGSAAIVGGLDDRLKMRGIYKPLLTLLCGLPILALGLAFPGEVYDPTLRVPLFAGYHLPVIYPLTILVAISVTSNAVNMLDPLNGSMAGGMTILSGGLLIGLLLKGAGSTSIFLYASLMFALLGFFYFNRFPARAFSGNVGQLSIGASVGALAILGRVEIASIVAMFPNIQNSFFFLSRIRRFTEHRELLAKPTKILEDGRLASSEDPKAPLTLVRTLLVSHPASEPDVVSGIFLLFVWSTSLAVITLLLTG